MPAWASILLGLLGALIGAGGAVGSQWVAAKRQDRRATRDRQFEAGARLLGAAYGVLTAAEELQLHLDTLELHDELRGTYVRFLERWDAYTDCFGPARLAAPVPVVEEARRLEESMYDLKASCDRWYLSTLKGTDHVRLRDIADDALGQVGVRRRDYVRTFRVQFPEYGFEPTERSLRTDDSGVGRS